MIMKMMRRRTRVAARDNEWTCPTTSGTAPAPSLTTEPSTHQQKNMLRDRFLMLGVFRRSMTVLFAFDAGSSFIRSALLLATDIVPSTLGT